MASVKTAVAVERSLFDRSELLARRLGLSRSALYARALEALLRADEDRRLFAQMNAACASQPDPNERRLRSAMRHAQARLVAGTW
jgi:hypothetical protein